MGYLSNPFKIELLKNNLYQISFKLSDWEVTKTVSEKTLLDLISDIQKATGLSKIAETFKCTGEEASKIKSYWDTTRIRNICENCNFKWIACYDCAVKCESPLERDLLLELKRFDQNPILQRRINRDGTFYDYPQEIDKFNILTIPDFYIESEKTKLCIYADGHTDHERTENRAIRDRNIDRELQKLGFKVLRYTGKEIRNGVKHVVENIILNIE